MRCFGCESEPEVGVLCQRCADPLLRASRFCPEQIQLLEPSLTEVTSQAWLIDGYGRPMRLRVGPGREALVVGRAPEADVAVLDPSVSQIHAELVYSGRSGAWYVLDRQSKNKTFVNDEPVQRSWLGDGDRVVFGGHVGFLFVDEPSPRLEEAERAVSRNRVSPVSTQGGIEGLEREPEASLSLEEADGGGIARVGDTVIPLSLLQLELLALLAQQLREDDAAGRRDVRGFVPSKVILASGLSFEARNVTTNNLKGLVRSTRNKFTQAGLPHVIEARQNLGYRLLLDPAR